MHASSASLLLIATLGLNGISRETGRNVKKQHPPGLLEGPLHSSETLLLYMKPDQSEPLLFTLFDKRTGKYADIIVESCSHIYCGSVSLYVMLFYWFSICIHLE